MTTPAAPAAPAAPGTTPVTTNLTPPLSPIQKAVAAAKENLKAATAAGAEEQKPPEGGAVVEGGEKKPDEGGEVKPVVEGGEQKPEEGGEQKPEAGAEAAEAAAAEIVVEIPARRAGEEPFKIAVEDEETAEHLRGLVKGALRRDDYNRQVESLGRQREELDLVEQHLRVDPVGFLTESIRPDIQVEVARHLMSIPEVYAAVTEEIVEWQDENVRRARTAELARVRSESSRTAERTLSQIQHNRAQGRLVRDTVEQITPAEMADEEATMFRDDCIADVAAHVRAHPDITRLRPEEVVGILGRRLRHYGFTPELALAALSSGQPVRRPTAARPAASAPASGTPDADEARTAGAKLKQEGEARRAAAAVPGAGAGARPTKAEPPAQQGVKERISWVRQLLGK